MDGISAVSRAMPGPDHRPRSWASAAGFRSCSNPFLNRACSISPDMLTTKPSAPCRAAARPIPFEAGGSGRCPMGCAPLQDAPCIGRVGLKLRSPAGQRGLHSVDRLAGAFPDQAIALPVRRLASSSANASDARHVCNGPRSPSRPPRNPPFSNGVETVGLGPACTRERRTRGMIPCASTRAHSATLPTRTHSRRLRRPVQSAAFYRP